jgi:hypothetical protein
MHEIENKSVVLNTTARKKEVRTTNCFNTNEQPFVVIINFLIFLNTNDPHNNKISKADTQWHFSQWLSEKRSSARMKVFSLVTRHSFIYPSACLFIRRI